VRIVGADLILEYQTGTPYATHILNLRAEPNNAPLFERVKIVSLTFDIKDVPPVSPAITTVTGPKAAEPQTEQVAAASVVAVAVSPVAIATSK
jgi:hypothetical protein